MEPDQAVPKVDVERHDAPPQDGDRPIPAEPATCTITDMAGDGFVFFTPALITTHGLFDRDPLLEFNRTHYTEDESLRPFSIDCQYPFFQGMGKGVLAGQFVDWDHRLYGVARETWDELREFVGALAWYDIQRYHYARAGHHSLKIVDPTAFYGRGAGDCTELPVVEITVFCVSGYRGFVWIAEAKDPPRTRPYPQVDPPRDGIKAEAEAVLGPPLSPEEIRKFRHESND